jgi:hypothetical protein
MKHDHIIFCGRRIKASTSCFPIREVCYIDSNTSGIVCVTGRESKIPDMMRDQLCASAAFPKTAPVRHPLDGRLGGLYA